MPKSPPPRTASGSNTASRTTRTGWWPGVRQWLMLAFMAALLLQVVFVLQIAALALLGGAGSTAFQRSAMWQIIHERENARWQHDSVAGDQIANTARRAVVASEDSQFFDHNGVDWNAIEGAWERNAQSERIRGGSTITQQLAKNLYLSSERSFLRKGQELVLAWLLELMLSKEQILNIYLNEVEWGLGIYGIEAASQHYFGLHANQLSQEQAARLAVMLPQPRTLGRNLQSSYMQRRTRTIAQRARQISLPSALTD